MSNQRLSSESSTLDRPLLDDFRTSISSETAEVIPLARHKDSIPLQDFSGAVSPEDEGFNGDGDEDPGGDVKIPIEEKALPPIPGPESIARHNLIILLFVGINTIATCFLVVLNKYIFSFPALRSVQISFTAWHVFCTLCILFFASLSPLRLFKRVYLNVWAILPLSGAFTGWIILNNLSLALNPLGFYQIAKILTTPTVVVLNYFLEGETVSRTVIGSLAAICTGAALTCKGSTDTTLLGSLVAVAAFITTALYQVWIGTKQKQEGVDSAQLLFNQSYLSLGLLMILVPFFDRERLIEATTPTDAGEKPLDPKIWGAIALSGVTAMVVNLTQFLIIGKTSAITFNVASHLKTAIILVAGWISQARGFGWIEVVGISIAVGGAAVYSFSTQ